MKHIGELATGDLIHLVSSRSYVLEQRRNGYKNSLLRSAHAQD